MARRFLSPVPPPRGTAAPTRTVERPRPRAVHPLLRQWRRPIPDGGEIPEGRPNVGALLRDAVYRRMLALADLVATGFALVMAIAVIGADSLTVAALATLPVIVAVNKAIGLYDRDQHLLRKTTLDEGPALFQVATAFAFVTWLGGGGILVEGSVTRPQALGLWVMLFVSLVLARAIGRRVAQRLAPAERCILIGDAEHTERIRRTFALSPRVEAELVGRVPLSEGLEDLTDEDVAGSMAELGLILAERDVHRAIIAPGDRDSDELLDIMRLVKSLGVNVTVLPRLFEVVGSSVEVDNVDGVMMLGVRRYGLTKSSRILKRGLDCAAAVAGLVALAPTLVVIAISIKLSSAGPVLFRQTRIGRGGEAFTMLKFRTMMDGADAQKEALQEANEASGLFKIADDPRQTPVGRFLRRASLDELPQLINVLRGEMSLVGPRPLVPEEDRRVEGWQRRRLSVKPGITGLWQIFGSSRIPLDEMVTIDYLYGANWSVWLDMKILLRTLPYALGLRGL